MSMIPTNQLIFTKIQHNFKVIQNNKTLFIICTVNCTVFLEYNVWQSSSRGESGNTATM